MKTLAEHARDPAAGIELVANAPHLERTGAGYQCFLCGAQWRRAEPPTRASAAEAGAFIADHLKCEGVTGSAEDVAAETGRIMAACAHLIPMPRGMHCSRCTSRAVGGTDPDATLRALLRWHRMHEHCEGSH